MNFTSSIHFVNELNLVNIATSQAGGAVLTGLIDKYEPNILTEILGYTMYSEFKLTYTDTSGIWYDLLNGADFTDSLGRANHWKGFKTVGSNPIACFIYYFYQRNQETITTGIGERKSKAENSIIVGSGEKVKNAWNEGVDMLWIMHDFLVVNKSVYPDYIGLTYPPYNERLSGLSSVRYGNNQYFQKITRL